MNTLEEPRTKADGVFGLIRKEDPNQLLAIHTREDVSENTRLSFGARLLFARLLDLALNPHLNNGFKGQIIVSIMQLCERLGASERTIARWTRELVSLGVIWISKIQRPNTKPINCYHIDAFQPARRTHQEVPGDGLWGNGYRRSDELGRNAQRGASGQFVRILSGLVDAQGNPIPSYFLENTTVSGQKGHLSAVMGDRSERSKLPLGAVMGVRSQRSLVTVESGRQWQTLMSLRGS